MSIRYTVSFDDYTTRYFIKKFKKRYSDKTWSSTEKAILGLCVNFNELKKLEQCDVINTVDNLVLCKLNFAVAGTQKSPKGSGNRCIMVVNVNKSVVVILLVYHKNDITGKGNETVEWKKIISTNFPVYRHLV